MISIFIDSLNNEIKVTRNGNTYFYLTQAEGIMATGCVLAFDVAHKLSHENNEGDVEYIGIAVDGRTIHAVLNFKSEVICETLRNFGESFTLSQTNFALQMLIWGYESQTLAQKEANKNV